LQIQLTELGTPPITTVTTQTSDNVGDLLMMLKNSQTIFSLETQFNGKMCIACSKQSIYVLLALISLRLNFIFRSI